MKKSTVLLCALLVLFSSVSMGAKKPPKNNKSAVGNNRFSLGFGMELADYYSPLLKKTSTFKNPVSFGPRITAWYNPISSVAIGLDLGSHAFATKENTSLPAINTYNLLYSLLFAYKFNNGYILKEDAAVAPYIFAKLQGSWAVDKITDQNVNGFGIPMGAGINFKVANNVALNVNGGYSFSIKNSNDHIFFGAGLMVDLGKGKEIQIDTTPIIVEKPIDTDGDGINDEQDKCPTEKGLARYNGCPIPDTDKDGVNDEEDKCSSRPGPASNMGCPEIAKEVIEKINFAAKNIFFATGSSKLLPKSFKSLNEVATLLAADQTLMIQIDGHTDNTGKVDKNKTLSEARANSVKAYLVSKGLAESRATTAGYGDTKPVADNKTAAGRAKNRRTEMTVRNY